MLVLKKPTGITSARVLNPIKRIVGRKVKVGHTGTLDPFSTGVMLVLIGNATRLANLAMSLSKTYEGTIIFGRQTDTLDPDGEVISEADPGSAPPPSLEAAVQSFQGKIEQVPPIFSAVKVDGKRAYRLARGGQTPELKPRNVEILKIAIEEINWPEVRISVITSSGVYIRSLARDIGNAIGLPASLISLTRTAVGPFTVDKALKAELESGERLTREILQEKLVSPCELVNGANMLLVPLDRLMALQFTQGSEVGIPDGILLKPGETAGITYQPETSDSPILLGLAKARSRYKMQPVTVLNTL